jgi:2-oxoglutarate ferredoxin oxidoreductase subunit beta
MKTKIQPFGTPSGQLNPLAIAIALNCSFVARGFVGDINFLQHLMTEAINHPGFALVDIFQPCVSFNKINTFSWFQERLYKLDDSHDPRDRVGAFAKSLEWGDEIPTGIFYRNRQKLFSDKIPALREKPLVKQAFDQNKTLSLLDEFF